MYCVFSYIYICLSGNVVYIFIYLSIISLRICILYTYIYRCFSIDMYRIYASLVPKMRINLVLLSFFC